MTARPGIDTTAGSSTLEGGQLTAGVHELTGGGALEDYRYEHGNEEWLLVLAGHPVLRTPDGEQSLAIGDVVCLPSGPGGARQLRHDSGEPVRVLRLRTRVTPAVTVYPDSGTIRVDPPGHTFRQAETVD